MTGLCIYSDNPGIHKVVPAVTVALLSVFLRLPNVLVIEEIPWPDKLVMFYSNVL
jgi:hypothetical protein